MHFLAAVAALALSAPGVAPQLLTRTDPSALSQQLDGGVSLSIRSLSSDGRVVVYGTDATNAVPGDTNSVRDTYAWNRQTQQVTRVSVASGGTQFDYETIHPAVSGDGQWALYATYRLIFFGGFGAEEVGEAYMRNLATGEQLRLGEVAVDGSTYRRARRPLANHDASIASFHTNSRLDPADTNAFEDVYLFRRATGAYQWVSRPVVAAATQRGARNAVISDAGDLVAFESGSDGLVAGDADGLTDVFVYEPGLDRLRRLADLIAVAPAGPSFHPSLSRNGRWLVFATTASNLPGGSAGLYRVDLQDGSVEQVLADTQDETRWRGRAITDDGRVLFDTFSAFEPADQNGTWDVYLWQAGVPGYRRMSSGAAAGFSEGQSVTPSVLADGSEMLFQSATRHVLADTNLYDDAHVRALSVDAPIVPLQLRSGPMLPPRANGSSEITLQSISSDGRFVVFNSYASDLVVGDSNNVPDLFLRDRELGTTRRISIAANGAQWSRGALCGAISADGRYAVLVTAGAELGDSQDRPLAVRISIEDGTLAVAGPTRGEAWSGVTGSCPVISGDGRYAAFGSTTSVAGSWNGEEQVYLKDFSSGDVQLLSSTPGGSAGGYDSEDFAISADGEHVAFWTMGALIPADQDGGASVYLWSRNPGGLRVSPGNGYRPSVAVLDGRLLVAFAGSSFAYTACATSNNYSGYLWDVAAGTVGCLTDGLPYVTANNGVTRVSLSPSGRHLAIAADACNFSAGACALTFDRDMSTGRFTTASMRADGLFSGYSYMASASDNGIVALSSSGVLSAEDNSPTRDIYSVDVRDVLFTDSFE